jgi:acyl-CoA thioester hydrolase
VLLNVGETTLVFVDVKTGRPIALPPSILTQLDIYYN